MHSLHRDIKKLLSVLSLPKQHSLSSVRSKTKIKIRVEVVVRGRKHSADGFTQTHMVNIQFVSMSPHLMCLMSLHDKEESVTSQIIRAEASLSHQEAVKTRWANVRRGSERLAQNRGHKSGSDSSGQTPCYDDANMANAITDPSVKKQKSLQSRTSRCSPHFKDIAADWEHGKVWWSVN